jgi:hypothetical protein
MEKPFFVGNFRKKSLLSYTARRQSVNPSAIDKKKLAFFDSHMVKIAHNLMFTLKSELLRLAFFVFSCIDKGITWA